MVGEVKVRFNAILIKTTFFIRQTQRSNTTISGSGEYLSWDFEGHIIVNHLAWTWQWRKDWGWLKWDQCVFKMALLFPYKSIVAGVKKKKSISKVYWNLMLEPYKANANCLKIICVTIYIQKFLNVLAFKILPAIYFLYKLKK